MGAVVALVVALAGSLALVVAVPTLARRVVSGACTRDMAHARCLASSGLLEGAPLLMVPRMFYHHRMVEWKYWAYHPLKLKTRRQRKL